MAERVKIYDGTLQTISENLTDPFQDGSFLYMEAPSISGEVEIDAHLQIYLPSGQNRRVSLIGERNKIIDTFSIWFIPGEIQAAGYDCKLAIIASDSIPVAVYVIKAGCSCQAKLDEINNKINLQIAGSLLNKLISIAVPLLVGVGAPQLLLPAAIGAAVRGLVEIVNPSLTEPVLIGNGFAPTANNNSFFLEPGGKVLIDQWQGQIFAAANGVQPIVREYLRED